MAEISDVDALRSANTALKEELEWTKAQHSRWSNEHQELIVFVRQLKARVDDCEAARLNYDERAQFEKMKQWNVELDSANRWLASQVESWQASYRQLEALCQEQKSAVADLLAARDWYAEQNAYLKGELDRLRNPQ
jgi:chromosome segregation ATPase